MLLPPEVLDRFAAVRRPRKERKDGAALGISLAVHGTLLVYLASLKFGPPALRRHHETYTRVSMLPPDDPRLSSPMRLVTPPSEKPPVAPTALAARAPRRVQLTRRPAPPPRLALRP